MKITKLTLLAMATVITFAMPSCLPLAAGAAAGYIAHDEGYRVTNPIKKVD